MKNKWIVLFAFLAAGCGEAPPPTGPASEATTPEVEVTMPDENASAAPANTTQVSFKVPGMT